MRPKEGTYLAHRKGMRSLGSFHGNMLTSAFGANIAHSMATAYECDGTYTDSVFLASYCGRWTR
jgi:hypothetical protein